MSTYDYMYGVGREPPLEEMLHDDIVQMLMRRDKVREKDLWPMLRQTAERIHYFQMSPSRQAVAS